MSFEKQKFSYSRDTEQSTRFQKFDVFYLLLRGVLFVMFLLFTSVITLNHLQKYNRIILLSNQIIFLSSEMVFVS